MLSTTQKIENFPFLSAVSNSQNASDFYVTVLLYLLLVLSMIIFKSGGKNERNQIKSTATPPWFGSYYVYCPYVCVGGLNCRMGRLRVDSLGTLVK